MLSWCGTKGLRRFVIEEFRMSFLMAGVIRQFGLWLERLHLADCPTV